MQELGFVPSRADTSLFIYNQGGNITYILIYVDNIIVTGYLSKAIDGLVKNLNTEFALKDLCELHYFLGIEVKKTNDGVVPSQSKYASEVLETVGMKNCKPVGAPMSTTEKLSRAEGTPLIATKSTKYRSTIRALQYFNLNPSRHILFGEQCVPIYASSH